MDKDLQKQVADVVDKMLNEKEEAKLREQIQAELEKAATTVSDLTTSLEEKNAEVAEMADQISANEDRVKELESELEAARKELETANEKLGESEKALEDMKKDRAAEVRMAELEDAGVARSDKETQMAKVREMSDEEFASYKDELVSVREAVMSELEKAREKAEADAKAEEEAAKAAADEEAAKNGKKPTDDEEDPKMKKKKSKKKEECSDNSDGETASEDDDTETASEDDETTTPAQITPGQTAMAALNMEYAAVSDDVAKQYSDLGKALAQKFTKKDE